MSKSRSLGQRLCRNAEENVVLVSSKLWRCRIGDGVFKEPTVSTKTSLSVIRSISSACFLTARLLSQNFDFIDSHRLQQADLNFRSLNTSKDELLSANVCAGDNLCCSISPSMLSMQHDRREWYDQGLSESRDRNLRSSNYKLCVAYVCCLQLQLTNACLVTKGTYATSVS